MRPDIAYAHNGFAWASAKKPDCSFNERSEALEHARQAVALSPEEGNFYDTLALAEYRAGHWAESIAAAERSIALMKDVDPSNWFFLAMALWQQGDKDRSRSYFDQAVAWTKKNDPDHADLLAFWREAAELLGKPGPTGPAARSARRPVRPVIPRRRIKHIMVDRLRVRLAANRGLRQTRPSSHDRAWVTASPTVEDRPRPLRDDLRPLPRCAPDRTGRSAVLWNPLIVDNQRTMSVIRTCPSMRTSEPGRNHPGRRLSYHRPRPAAGPSRALAQRAGPSGPT